MLARATQLITTLFCLCGLLAAQNGTVTKVDHDQKTIAVRVAETEYSVIAGNVQLLDSEGKAAELTAFKAKDKVDVKIVDGMVTQIRMHKAAGLALLPVEAMIMRIDADKAEIALKIDGTEHVVSAHKVKLLDKDGKPAKLDAFKAKQKVDATVVEGVVTVIQARE